MDRLIHWALCNRPLVLVAALFLSLAGLATARRMPVDVFPDLTAPTVTVMTEVPGMAPTEVENLVTFPLEVAVNGAPGVRRVRSATGLGLSIVWIEFDWGTHLREARQVVTEKITPVADQLPPEAGRPSLTPPSSLMGEILYIALSSDRHSPADLRTHAETVLRRRLLAVPGVAQVTPIGGAEKQYQVVADPIRLASAGVSLSRLLDALSQGNANTAAGVLSQGGVHWAVRGLGRMRSIADIGATGIPGTGEAGLRVADVASVRIGEAPRRGEGSSMGRPAVILGITKQPGANTLELTRRLDDVFAELTARLPQGMSLRTDIFRQADFIATAIGNVRRALMEGVVLVTLVILLFLANGRATVITLTAIPLSLVTAILTLRQFGSTIDTMTLGGMAIAVGALVDDAVIDVENVVRRLRGNLTLPEASRRPALRVVLEASLEIRGSIVFATLIIALVFVPVFFLGGVEGRLLQPLGVAYLTSLLASLLVAVTVTPVLCSFLLPSSPGVHAEQEPRFSRWLKRGYQPLLDAALDHPRRVLLPALAALALALAAIPGLGRAFLPEFNEGSLTLTAATLPGTALADSAALGLEVEKALLEFPEVVAVARRTGRAELDEHIQGAESSEIEVSLRLGDRARAPFLAALRARLARVPGLAITIGQPISHRIDHMLSGTRAAIAVKIFGPDLHRLRATAQSARQAMETIEGLVDLSVDSQSEVPLLTVRLDREAIARHGLSIAEVSRTLQAAIDGTRVSRILEDQSTYDLVVRLDRPEGWRLETLHELPVDLPSGGQVPLGTLARIRRETGPDRIQREQVERKIVVQANVSGRDVTSVVRDIRAAVDSLVAAQPGLRVEYGGQFESAAAAGRTLLLVGAGTVLAIGFLLHLAFRSARDAVLVMLNLPLALIGGVIGVFVGGGILSVASLIGFISVFGIAARNGIMLVSHVRHLQTREGVPTMRGAVHRGAMERLVPILMTALAAGLALIPLALGGDQPGNEIQTPMALVILFGLLSSMALNMLVVPALLLHLGTPPAHPSPDAPAPSGPVPASP